MGQQLPGSTRGESSAASDVYKRQLETDRVTALVAGSESDLELAMFSGGNVLRLVGPFLDGAVLGAMLDDPSVFLGCFNQLLALENIVAQWFLNIYVLTRLACPDSCLL